MEMKALVEWCFDVIFPRRCVGCGRERTFLCADCKNEIPLSPPACFRCRRRSPTGEPCAICRGKTRMRRFTSPLPYREPVVRELIRLFKYRGATEIARVLADFIGASLKDYGITPDTQAILVPIPLHPKRLRERGFNQAELIAEALAARFGLSLNTHILRRTIYRKRQVEIKDRRARIENAKGVYAIKTPPPRGATVILVDDVSTTGATLAECAKILRQAGAKRVWGFVAAR